MSWMSDGLEMKTNTGGGIGKAFSRMFSGESIFQKTYTATKNGDFITFDVSKGKIIAKKLHSC